MAVQRTSWRSTDQVSIRISIACTICRMALAWENRSPRLQTFVIEVLKLFSPKNLKTRGYLRSIGSTPQSIPEAQFQQEFYRACCNYTKSTMITLPECGTPKGRIDFFLPSKKWGIELLRDGDRLLAHNERFEGGEYGKWVQAGMMDDYIMIDFRSTVPIIKLGKRIITTRKTIIYKNCRSQMFICCFNRWLAKHENLQSRTQ